jgi:hypothetical protein
MKRRRSTRRTQREVILQSNLRSDISAESDEESDPFDASPMDTTAQDTSNIAFVSRNDYTADDFDENYFYFPENSVENEFTSLFNGSDVSVRATVHLLVAFLIDSNLDKRKSTRLLQLIKSLLPQPNRLPKTWSINKISDNIPLWEMPSEVSSVFLNLEKQEKARMNCISHSECLFSDFLSSLDAR